MPIEVEDIQPPEVEVEAEPDAQVPEAMEEPAASTDPTPSAKKRGRPPGAKNKPKPKSAPAPYEPSTPKKQPPKKKQVVQYESEESSDEEPLSPPPSPSTQRKLAWQNYRQKQVDAHQARQSHYANARDKMVGF